MDSEQGKLFIGGISSNTTEERLKDYFSNFGDVLEVEIKKDRITGRLRGFGFIVFADPAVADRVLLEKHNIDGRMVEVKKAISRDEQHRSNTVGNGSRGQRRTKKIFVGGLAPTVTENDMRNYFQQFGTIMHAAVMFDPITQASRGFGFIIYDSENVVDLVLQNPFHQLNGKMVEVKQAIPKVFPNGREGNFGASNAHGFNSTLVPPVNRSYGYSSYGPTGYNTPNYGSGAGYGPAFNGGNYDNTTFMNNNRSYVGVPISYGVPTTMVYGSTDSSAGYGGSGSGRGSGSYVGFPIDYGVPTPIVYGSTDSSVGYGGGGSGSRGGGISQYGAPQVDNGQSNGSNAGYGEQNPFHQLNRKMVEVKQAIPKVFPNGREGNFGASNAHGFNSTLVPPVNRGYGYSSYGPTGYNTPNYGSGAGYGPAFNGGNYDNTTFMNNNRSYVGVPISYGVPTTMVYGSTDSSAGYGGSGSGSGSGSYVGFPIDYGVPTPIVYGSTDSSVGYGGGGSGSRGGGISQYGAPQVDNGQSNGSNAGYGEQTGGYETGFAPHG